MMHSILPFLFYCTLSFLLLILRHPTSSHLPHHQSLRPAVIVLAHQRRGLCTWKRIPQVSYIVPILSQLSAHGPRRHHCILPPAYNLLESHHVTMQRRRRLYIKERLQFPVHGIHEILRASQDYKTRTSAIASIKYRYYYTVTLSIVKLDNNLFLL